MKELLKKLLIFCLNADKLYLVKGDKVIIAFSNYAGLCEIAGEMASRREISYPEYELLGEFIVKHRPKWYQKHFSWRMIGKELYWQAYLTEPRIYWIIDQYLKADK